MAWKFLSDSPVYLQIADRIRSSIVSGEYIPGQQLPTVRQFATMAAVNPNTVQHAFSELEDEGIIISRGTAGRFVTPDISEIDKCRRIQIKKLLDNFLSYAEQLSFSKREIIAMIEEDEK